MVSERSPRVLMKRICRNSVIGVIAGGVVGIVSTLYPNPQEQAGDLHNRMNITTSYIERELNAYKSLLPFDDSIIIIAENYSDEQRNSLEKELEGAYQIREEIRNSPEYAEYENIDGNKTLGVRGGLLLLFGAMGYFVISHRRLEKSKKLKKVQV